jgi:hypothetical protein
LEKLHKEWIKPGHRTGRNTHNVSVTISLKPEEWVEVGEWAWSNRNNYTALSCLPYDNGSYVQAPFETITEEQFNEAVTKLHEVDLSKVIEAQDNTDQKGELACAGGSCFGFMRSPKVAPSPSTAPPPAPAAAPRPVIENVYAVLLKKCIKKLRITLPTDVAKERAVLVIRNTCMDPNFREALSNYQLVESHSSNLNRETVIVRPCGHRFHRNCINHHISTGRTNCPVCRGPLNRPQYGGRRKTRLRKAKNQPGRELAVLERLVAASTRGGSAHKAFPL